MLILQFKRAKILKRLAQSKCILLSKSAPMERTYRTEWHDSLDSTNSEALRRSAGLGHLTVIAARRQTAGRGQRGNRWLSAEGENLTFSIFLRFSGRGQADTAGCPALKASGQFFISEAAAIAQCRFLSRYGIQARIKWPNDIYAGDRKISGMLVENSLSGENVRTSVIGIGLNVNQTEFPPELPNPVSMALLTGEKYGIESLLDGFMDEFTGCLALIEDPAGIRGIYESLMYRIGTVSRFCDLSGRPAWLPANAIVRDRYTGPDMSDGNNGPEFDGIIRGITEDGRLEISLGQGITGTFSFKEIAFVI